MNQLVTILSAALIAGAIVFYALANRFEFTSDRGTGSFVFDRMTGKVQVCREHGAGGDCFPFQSFQLREYDREAARAAVDRLLKESGLDSEGKPIKGK